MPKAVIRPILTSSILFALTFSLTSCSISIDSETKDQGETAICASADSLISQIKAGGEGAKIAAQVIKSNSDDKNIKSAAQKVIDGKESSKTRKELSQYVNKKCN